MRRLGRSVIAALCTAALLVGCSDAPTPTENVSDVTQPAFAAGGPIVASVTGSGHRYRPGPELWRTFSITAVKKANGTVKGQYQINNHGEALPAVKGPVVCLTVDGNQAWIGVIIEKTDDPGGGVGQHLAIQVVDNGEGTDAAPDQISGGHAVDDAQQFCDSPYDLNLVPIDAGNIQVHSMGGRCVRPPTGLVGWWPGDGDGDDIVEDKDESLPQDDE